MGTVDMCNIVTFVTFVATAVVDKKITQLLKKNTTYERGVIIWNKYHRLYT
jgi:hypothetical protein